MVSILCLLQINTSKLWAVWHRAFAGFFLYVSDVSAIEINARFTVRRREMTGALSLDDVMCF
jgi:hypothetical protein